MTMTNIKCQNKMRTKKKITQPERTNQKHQEMLPIHKNKPNKNIKLNVTDSHHTDNFNSIRT